MNFRPGIIFLLCFFLLGAISARAAEVSAALSDPQTDVGQAVDYSITVTGGEGSVPENISVDGLTITYTGQSTQTQINFGNLFGSGSHSQTSTIYTYSVVPQRTGQFTIPAQTLDVNGQRLATRPVNLVVGGNANRGGGGGGGNEELYFARLIIPKTSVYVGEAVPAEVKIYVEAQAAVQLLGQPNIAAESCTLQPLTKPVQTQIERGGRAFVVVTYKTALTPAKAGTLKIGPVSADAMVRIPQTRSRRHSTFGGPMLDDPFFDDAFRMMSPPQQVSITSEATELDVKPLPAAGQPASFAGAVGQYTLSTTVKPAMVEAGDPITITAKIEGRGNFDRVTAPQLGDPNGWRVYPPSAKFSADDDIGISGSKTFEMAVIPQVNKTESPRLEWSYFDPDKEMYVTLTGSSVPIRIEGQIQSSPPPVASQPQPRQPAIAAATPTPSSQDILYIRVDSAGWGETFQPLYERGSFWAAQAAPLLALLGFIGFRVRNIRAADLEARRREEFGRQKEAALGAMRGRDASERDVYQGATDALRLEAALHTGRSAATLGPEDVIAARNLDCATAEKILRLFERLGEELYAGASRGSRPASPETRAEMIELVRKYENAKSAA